MRKVIEELHCDQCGIKIDNVDKCIKLDKGDLDIHGIWFGDLGDWLWFDDEKFCSWTCFLAYVENWRVEQKPKQEAE